MSGEIIGLAENRQLADIARAADVRFTHAVRLVDQIAQADEGAYDALIQLIASKRIAWQRARWEAAEQRKAWERARAERDEP